MSLRTLPKIDAPRPAHVAAFDPDPAAIERWNAGLRAAEGDDASISILDVIGDDFDGGVTVRRVAAALRSIGSREVTVNINSPGGDFFEGVAIYNALRAHPHKVTVRVLGVAASAASLIAMAGDHVEIGKAGFLMIHNAWAVAIGNRHDFREAADTLEPFDGAMAAVYAERSGASAEQVAEWMDAEKWFNGEQAVEAGLADALLPADAVEEGSPVAAKLNATRRADALLGKAGLSRSERRSLLGELKGGTHDAAADATHDAGDDWAANARALMETLRN